MVSAVKSSTVYWGPLLTMCLASVAASTSPFFNAIVTSFHNRRLSFGSCLSKCLIFLRIEGILSVSTNTSSSYTVIIMSILLSREGSRVEREGEGGRGRRRGGEEREGEGKRGRGRGRERGGGEESWSFACTHNLESCTYNYFDSPHSNVSHSSLHSIHRQLSRMACVRSPRYDNYINILCAIIINVLYISCHFVLFPSIKWLYKQIKIS